MVRYRSATITEVCKADGDGLFQCTVLFRNVPLGVGFDGSDLGSQRPWFWIHMVVGFVWRKKPSDYKEFGPKGLAKGAKVLCKVDDIIPAGHIYKVKPPAGRKIPKKR